MYKCNPVYELVGKNISRCNSGVWNSDVPICKSELLLTKKTFKCLNLTNCFPESGCSPLNRTNGAVTSFDNWASASLECGLDFEVAGSKSTYCDGSDWDRTMGYCRNHEVVNTTISCDFENDSLCGWSWNDSKYFKWKRSNGLDNVKNSVTDVRSGITFDHTTKDPKNGFFLIAKPTSLHDVDIAKLTSPVYEASPDLNTCFRFYLQMFGDGMGSLRVNVTSDSR